MIIIKAIHSVSLPGVEELKNWDSVLSYFKSSSVKNNGDSGGGGGASPSSGSEIISGSAAPSNSASASPGNKINSLAKEGRAIVSDASKNLTSGDLIPEEKAVPQLTSEQSSYEISVLEFLKYCREYNEAEIYYLLLNDVEIKNFNEEKLELCGGRSFPPEIIAKIKEMLSSFRPAKTPRIVFTSSEEFTCLKNKLLEEALADKNFLKIKNHFPRAKISDILLYS